MKATILGASLLACVVSSATYAQQVSSFADVAGSWRGNGRQTGTDVMYVIAPDGKWTVASQARNGRWLGQEAGQGKLTDGIYLMTLKDGYGDMRISKEGDGLTVVSKWYDGQKWQHGQVDAKRCAKPDCTDKGPALLRQ
jgi:hypothetical protein